MKRWRSPFLVNIVFFFLDLQLLREVEDLSALTQQQIEFDFAGELLPIDLRENPFPHPGKNDFPKCVRDFESDEEKGETNEINVHVNCSVEVNNFTILRGYGVRRPQLLRTLPDFYLTIATIALLREFFGDVAAK
ncbi:hypothetical protein [[Limnothrix rosea] IAM M-220]|uniref:hypothetical protein n=1 Tax=[Limnothrix rosea] IAM M-220 TaxID=454133 RepID=UPI00096438D7|nr:hypothetical protein [[Limnothrix rosea] IAM M-220]OKH16036.1 hypothetical protein NIES208_12265 [[Limnothrix rosea] IAM M-220]